MEKLNISNTVNNVSFGKKYASKTVLAQKANKSQIKDGDKKLMDTLKWVGIIAAGTLAVGGAVSAINKGRIPKLEKVKDESGKIIKKIGDKTLTYDKGVAMLDGKKAKGILKFTTSNGSTLTYYNGILRNSAKAGKEGFTKVYNSAGKLKEAYINKGNGLARIVHKYNKNGNLESIKNSVNGKTNFEYASNGNLTDVTRNNESLMKKIQSKSGEDYLASVEDMSEAGLLKAQLEEKIADGQISNLQDALDMGYTEAQVKNAGFYEKLTPNPNRQIELSASKISETVPDSLQGELAQLEEKIADGQISNLQDALDLGYTKEQLTKLGFI